MNKQQIAAKNYLMRAYRIDNRINSMVPSGNVREESS